MIKENRVWEAWDDTAAARLSAGWNDPWRGKAHARLLKKAASLIVGEDVLDVGCGAGSLYPLVKDRVEYLGIDTSPSMLKKAKEIFPQDADRFQEGDVYDLSDFPKVDTVLAIGLILHLPNPGGAIAQLCDCAKQCVIMTACIGNKPLTKIKGSAKRHFVLRRDTRKDVLSMIEVCPNIANIEEMPFKNRTFGESNYFFRIWKEQICEG